MLTDHWIVLELTDHWIVFSSSVTAAGRGARFIESFIEFSHAMPLVAAARGAASRRDDIDL